MFKNPNVILKGITCFVGQNRKEGSYHHKSTRGRTLEAAQQTHAPPGTPRRLRWPGQRGVSYRRALGGRRPATWTADAQVQYEDHFAANPEKLISVFTLVDRENPTVT